MVINDHICTKYIMVHGVHPLTAPYACFMLMERNIKSIEHLRNTDEYN